MATKPRSYKKGAYTYTESSPGSNKFQNFTAKPTVKEVRDTSRKDKAKVAVTKTSPSATPTSDYRSPKVMSSATPTSDYRGTPVRGTPKANRQGGMDTGNVMKPNAVLENRKWAKAYEGAGTLHGQSRAEAYRKPSKKKVEDASPAPAKKSIVGSIIDRVTQPPKKLTPASEKILAEARAEITPVVGALAVTRLGYKGIAKGLNKILGPKSIFYKKKPSVPQSNREPRPISELGKPKTKLTPRQKAAKKGVKTKKNVKQFLNETGLAPRPRGSTWQY